MWPWRTSSGDPRQDLGRRGEKAAERYLRRRGYRLLGRNVHCGRNELDLIFRRGDTIVFVEVRTRHAEDAVAPDETVDERKQAQVRHAARWWLQAHDVGETYCRFDVVAVILPARGRPQITHYPDAFGG